MKKYLGAWIFCLSSVGASASEVTVLGNTSRYILSPMEDVIARGEQESITRYSQSTGISKAKVCQNDRECLNQELQQGGCVAELRPTFEDSGPSSFFVPRDASVELLLTAAVVNRVPVPQETSYHPQKSAFSINLLYRDAWGQERNKVLATIWSSQSEQKFYQPSVFSGMIDSVQKTNGPEAFAPIKHAFTRQDFVFDADDNVSQRPSDVRFAFCHVGAAFINVIAAEVTISLQAPPF